MSHVSSQLMVGLVCGQHGQDAVNHVALVAIRGAEPVLTPLLLMEDRTALGTIISRRSVNWLRVLVSQHVGMFWTKTYQDRVVQSPINLNLG